MGFHFKTIDAGTLPYREGLKPDPFAMDDEIANILLDDDARSLL